MRAAPLRQAVHEQLHRRGPPSRRCSRSAPATPSPERFRGDNVIFAIVLLGIIFPYEVTVIPLYYDFQRFDPPPHLLGADSVQIGQSVSFGTFLRPPRSLIEAARIDGATSFVFPAACLLPQAWPALMTSSGTLVFVYTWKTRAPLALVLIHTRKADGPVRASRTSPAPPAPATRPRSRPRCPRRRSDPGRLRLPAAAFHRRHAGGRSQGVMRVRGAYSIAVLASRP